MTDERSYHIVPAAPGWRGASYEFGYDWEEVLQGDLDEFARMTFDTVVAWCVVVEPPKGGVRGMTWSVPVTDAAGECFTMDLDPCTLIDPEGVVRVYQQSWPSVRAWVEWRASEAARVEAAAPETEESRVTPAG